jgi:hypothetical protein
MAISNRDAPDTVFAGYLVNPKAGYRISSRILDFTTIFLVKYQVYIIKKKQHQQLYTFANIKQSMI